MKKVKKSMPPRKRAKPKERPDDYVKASTINWYPGHMAKALRQVKDSLKKVHLILEVRDARVPITSGNDSLHKIVGQKNRIIILNKVNLISREAQEVWEKWFKDLGEPFLFLNSFDKASVKQLMTLARKIVQDKREENSSNTALKIMVMGLPNTGKSTIINHVADKKATRAADKPGHTQHQQWVSIGDGVQLMDTPGIMPPRIDTDEQGYWLCAIHAIRDEILGEDAVAYFVIDYLLKHSCLDFQKRYKINELAGDANSVIEQIALARKFIKQKGLPDLNRAYKAILQDFRKGELGKVCFELPATKERK